MPKAFDPWLHDPQRTMLLTHADGLQLSPSLSSAYRNQREHDPIDIDRAREIASLDDPIPVGILYRNPDAPCYEDLRHAGQMRSPEYIRAGLNRELDKYTVWPDDDGADAARGLKENAVMDMQAKHQDQLIFHLTGKRQGDGLAAIDGLDLRPALLAPYRDLAALRHDFPVVLVERAAGTSSCARCRAWSTRC